MGGSFPCVTRFNPGSLPYLPELIGLSGFIPALQPYLQKLIG